MDISNKNRNFASNKIRNIVITIKTNQIMKLNNANQVEAIDITITKEKYPIVFENKVQELMDDCGMTREKAENEVEGMVIECEIYYHKSCGLWATEQGHVESGIVYDPYDGEVCEEPDED